MIRQIRKSLCELLLRMSSSSIEISCLSSLLDMRLIRSRILVTEDSYECIEDSILAIDNRID